MTPDNKESAKEPYQHLCFVCKQNTVDSQEINSQEKDQSDLQSRHLKP